jgi:tetratricopeptide (TPR) repeat protein/membrane protease YdiL (CAAX protease family)
MEVLVVVLILILILAFFVGGGVNVLRTGRIQATKTSVIGGPAARAVGLLLLAAVPLSVLTYFFHATLFHAVGLYPDGNSPLPIIAGLIPLLGCPLVAVVIGLAAARPSNGPLPAAERVVPLPVSTPIVDNLPSAELVIPIEYELDVLDVTAHPVRPHPGFWGAVGWTVLLVLGQAILAIPVLAAAGLGSERSSPVLTLATTDSTLLLTAAIIITRLFGDRTRLVLAVRRAGVFHLVLAALMAPPLVVVGTATSYSLFRPSVAALPGPAALSDTFATFDQLAAHSWLAIVLVGCLLPAFGEEAFFRGFLSRGLVGRYGIAYGTLLTAALFGVMHVFPANICVAVIIGIACQLVFLSARSLLAPILLHGLYNLLVLSTEKLDGWTRVGLFRADGSLLGGLVAVAAAAVAGLIVVLYQTRVRWLRADGQPWSPGYPTAEMPPAAEAAMPWRGTSRVSGVVPAFATYLGFAALAAYQSGPSANDLRARFDYAQALYDQGAYVPAITVYDGILAADPTAAWVYNGRGSAHGMAGRYDAALADFTRAMDLEPKSADYRANRGWAHKLKGDWARAIEDCDEAIRFDPRLAFAFYIRGLARAKIGQWRPAQDDLDETVRLGAADADIHEWRGYVLTRQQDWDRAIEAYGQSIRLDPARVSASRALAEAYLRRGQARARSGKLGPALEDFDQAVKLNPADAYTHEWRACVLGRQNKWDQSIEAYTETIRLDPSRPSAYQARAGIYAYCGEYDRAVADYGEFLRLSPNDVDVLRRRCDLHLRRRNFAKCLEDADAVLRLKPDDVGTLTHRAWVRATCPEEAFRDAKKAVADAERANQLTDGNSMWAQHTLAAAYAEAGRFDDAVKAEQRTVELAPDADKSDFEEYVRWYESGQPYRDEPSDG